VIAEPPSLVGAFHVTFAAPFPKGVAVADGGAFGAIANRPMELFVVLVNHMAPSGPDVMSDGNELSGRAKPETTPAVVIRPIKPMNCPG
jgi:hypothetical protein